MGSRGRTESTGTARIARQIERRLTGFRKAGRREVLSGGYAPSQLRWVGASVPARQAGYELIERRKDVRSSLTGRQVRALGRGNNNWASVDGFSAYVSGPAWKRGILSDADVMRWAKSSNPWWRRTALASAVALNRKTPGSNGDATRTLQVCRVLAGDEHPLVIKAVSRALRSLVAHDPSAVRNFVEDQEDVLARSVVREVRAKLETGRKKGRA